MEKLDQKYGGEKRLLQRYLEAIFALPDEETNLKELEILSDHLTDVVVIFFYFLFNAILFTTSTLALLTVLILYIHLHLRDTC